MNIRLDAVNPHEKDALFQLLQYSLFEESATDFNEMNGDALFDYPWFELYFTDADRWAYLIREDETDRLLGFAMVRQLEDQRSFMIAEFMVVPKYRRNGVGKQAAIGCFERFRGSWEVSPAFGSEQALLFWTRIIDEYTDGAYRFEDGKFLFRN